MVDVLSVVGAARRLGVSGSTVRRLCEAGKLRAEMTPLGRLIDEGSVEALARERNPQDGNEVVEPGERFTDYQL